MNSATPTSPGIAALLAALPDLAARRTFFDRRLERAGAERLATDIEGLLRAAVLGEESARGAALAIATWAIHQRSSGAGAAVESVRNAAIVASQTLAALVLENAAATRTLPRLGRLPEIGLPSERAPARPTARLDPHGLLGIRAPAAALGPLDAHYAERARLHPSPRFASRLLQKQWLRPRDVLVMASRRPTTPALAYTIAICDVHIGKLAVREALVQNPFTPGGLALTLLPTIGARTLGRIARAGEVSPSLMRAAALLLQIRHEREAPRIGARG